MPAYVGRGEFKLDTVSVGVSSELTLNLEVESWRRESWAATPGGPESISNVPIRATVEVVLIDYTAANLLKLSHGSGTSPVNGMLDTGTEYALEFSGINKADGCSTLTLSAPKFLITASDQIQLITEGFAAPRITGEILRTPGGSPEWFTLQLGP